MIINSQPQETDALTQGTNRIKANINVQYKQLVRLLDQAASWVWRNPLKKTPQEVVDSFGTDAAELFTLSNLLCSMLTEISGQAVSAIPDGYSVDVNEDGTVTIVEAAPTET